MDNPSFDDFGLRLLSNDLAKVPGKKAADTIHTQLEGKVQLVRWAHPVGSQEPSHIFVGSSKGRKSDLGVHGVDWDQFTATSKNEPLFPPSASLECAGDLTSFCNPTDQAFFLVANSFGYVSIQELDEKALKQDIEEQKEMFDDEELEEGMYGRQRKRYPVLTAKIPFPVLHTKQQSSVSRSPTPWRPHKTEITALDMQHPNGKTILSTSDNGDIHLTQIQRRDSPEKRSTKCPITDAVWSSTGEIYTVGMGARIDKWDKRMELKASSSFVKDSRMFTCCTLTEEENTGTVATGSEEGAILIWDTRNMKLPLCTSEAHNGPVWRMMFSPEKPDILVSCGEDGNIISTDIHNLNGEGTITNIVAREFLSYNSVDIVDIDSERGWLVAGSDSGKIRFVNRDLIHGSDAD